MISLRWLTLLGGVVWLAGCSGSTPSVSPEVDEDALPYVTAAELKTAMVEQERPLLVEFCVPVGCYRCDEMRPQVNQLALDQSDDIEVVRVNLNDERALAIQMGVTVCPSYFVFDGGQEMLRIAYPTSGDLIASQLAENLRVASAE